MTQNVRKAMRSVETSHRMQRAHRTCIPENQHRLSSSYYHSGCDVCYTLLVCVIQASWMTQQLQSTLPLSKRLRLWHRWRQDAVVKY